MTRCVAALFLALQLASNAHAQAVQRNFPATALRGEISFGQPPEVLVNGQPTRLAPAARIRGLNNALTGVASQTSVNAIAAQVSGLATQSSVNGILIGLNNALAGVATQSSVNALDTKVSTLQAKIDDLQDALDSVGSSSLQVTLMQVKDTGS